MHRDRFDTYIDRFNAEDVSAFEDFIAPDMLMINGTLEFRGVEGMKDHYQNKIWPFFRERLNVLHFVSDEATAAVQMWTNFQARAAGETLFGAVVEGDQFDYRGLILYDIAEGKFTRIVVSYNSFVKTCRDGTVVSMGLPH